MPAITTLVGNPQPASRTLAVAEAVAVALAARSGGTATVGATIDLAEHAAGLFVFPEPGIDALSAQVAAADVLIVASPTYKASYTGLLKAFLDRFGTNALQGVTAIPVLTIGSPAHALAVEHALRPLLVELGASVPTRGLAFATAEFEQRDIVVGKWLDEQWGAIAPALEGTR